MSAHRGRLLLAFAAAAALAMPAAATAASTYTQVAAGQFHTCAVVTDGSVQCWGRNDHGQIGDGTTTAAATPVTVAGITTATSVAAGEGESCAVLAGGQVRCWGWNDRGRLGDGTTEQSPTPVEVRGVAGAAGVSVGGGASGGGHACAVLRSGGVRCWGRNDNGQLGDGTTTARPVAVAVRGIADARAVSAGGSHTCAVLRSGGVRCWGSNAGGRLGDGTLRTRTSPVAVSGISGATAVSAGGGHTCALLGGGGVRCWGSNDDGQLGDGGSASRRTPGPVLALGAALLDAGGGGAGGGHTCAAPAGAPVQCWGFNDFGELGDGTTTSRGVPAPVSRADVVATGLTSGAAHTCALLEGGRVSCWGRNAEGQLGDGTRTDRADPVDVLAPAAPASPVGASVVSGVVLVRVPGGAFVPLAPGQPLPQGAEVDATGGAVRISPPGQGGDSAVFSQGVFVYRQLRVGGRLWTELTLSQPLACGKAPRAAVVATKRRRLWGDGKGKFRTRGRDASAGVRGTRWLTADTCATTTIRVARGVVTVRDFVRRRTLILRAPKSYTARRRA